MFSMFSRWSRSPATAPAERVYAIGDVHGRLDLLQDLLHKLEDDVQARAPCSTRVILLGDIIDRGPHSRQLLELAQATLPDSDRVIILLGNHEELLLESAAGDASAQRVWLANGGDETLRSYGLDPVELMRAPAPEIARTIVDAVGEPVLAWLETLPLTYQSGDYFFCHAGIRPGVPLSLQRREDLLWIRDKFLESKRDHGAVIVHGHCESQEVFIGRNRIGIDTAAYRTGCLSAIGLHGTQQWILTTEAGEQRRPSEAQYAWAR
jgi:serine/threonine protein phosphatase 1